MAAFGVFTRPAFSQSCVPAPANLVSWWTGDNSPADFSGTNHGVMVNGATYGGGEVRQAFSFNGNVQYVEIPDSVSLDPTNALTLECWVFLRAFNPGSGGIAVFEKGGGSDALRQYEIGILFNNGAWRLRPHVWLPDGMHSYFGTAQIQTNTWYHVAMTYDGAVLKSYLNGVPDGSLAASGPINVSTHPVWLGGDPEGPWNLNGLIDEASLYNRALTAAEIQGIYNAGSAGKCQGTNPPLIVSQPTNQAVVIGSVITANVLATGAQPLAYQWSFNGTNIVGATIASLQISNVQVANAGSYSVIVSNAYGVVASSNAVIAVETPPFFVSQPQSQAALQGSPASFSVTAGGDAPLGYQWQFNNANIAGATLSSLAFASVQGSNAGNYRVKVSSPWGSITSTNATLTVQIPPTIVAQPVSTSVTAGNSAAFSVGAAGSAPLAYQWQFGGVTLPGQTSSALTIPNSQPTNAGNYSVIVSNSFGVVVSSNALLVVNSAGCTPAPGGIVGWWPLNGDLTDSVHGDTGIATSPVFTTGKVGSAMVFNGTSNGIRVPASSNLNVGVGSGLSIEMWINPSNAASEQPLVEWNSNSGGANGIGVLFWLAVPGTGGGAGSIWANLTDTNHAAHQLSTATGLVVANTYQHVAMTYDKPSGMLVIYLNGSAAAQLNVGSAFVPNTSSDVYFGTRPAGGFGPNYFSGKLDEISIYNRGLTAAEITAIYNASSGGKCADLRLPSISGQPTNQSVVVGATVDLIVTAAGAPPLSYQWLFNGTNLAGATTSDLQISNVQSANAGLYSVVVSNAYGSVVSSNALLTVHTAPYIIGVHAVTTVVQGASATFSVTAGGDLPLSYQWLLGGTNIAGATGTAYTIVSAKPSDAGVYSVVVSNPYGTVTSSGSNLTVLSPPSIVTQPASSTVLVGSNAVFSVVASGTPTLQYQWYYNGSSAIAGATGSSLVLNNAQLANDGTYSVTVSNVYGSVVSSNAILTVLAPGCQPPAAGLVDWWKAEGNANDSVGPNNGTLVNGVTFAAGVVGQAFSFNGNNQYVQVGDSPSLNPVSGITVEGWFYLRAFNSSSGIALVEKGGGEDVARQYELVFSAAHLAGKRTGQFPRQHGGAAQQLVPCGDDL